MTVDAHEFELLRRHTGPNALVDLSVDGKKAQPVLINQVQIHPVHRRPLHADLFLVRMTEELTVDVPLVATGISYAVDQLGGTLLHPTETVRVRALPDHLPQSIEYSIESLVDFDVAIHVRDLTVPADVTLLTDGDEIIAKVQAAARRGRGGAGRRRGRGGCRGRGSRRGRSCRGRRDRQRLGQRRRRRRARPDLSRRGRHRRRRGRLASAVRAVGRSRRRSVPGR